MVSLQAADTTPVKASQPTPAKRRFTLRAFSVLLGIAIAPFFISLTAFVLGYYLYPEHVASFFMKNIEQISLGIIGYTYLMYVTGIGFLMYDIPVSLKKIKALRSATTHDQQALMEAAGIRENWGVAIKSTERISRWNSLRFGGAIVGSFVILIGIVFGIATIPEIWARAPYLRRTDPLFLLVEIGLILFGIWSLLVGIKFDVLKTKYNELINE